jgi:hypothetical protein
LSPVVVYRTNAKYVGEGNRNVVTSFANPQGLASRGLVEKRGDRVVESGPHRGAPHDQTEEQCDAAAQLGTPFFFFPAPSSLGRRVHDLTVLSAIAGVQLLWLSALGYGFFSVAW